MLLLLAATLGPANGGSPAAASDGWPDVVDANPFHDDIGWLADVAGATGYPDGTFRPTAAVSRQALVQLLWQMSGSPAGPFPPHGFSDVAVDHPFATAIAWASDEVVVTGYPDGTFRPGGVVSRQAATAVLYRLAAMHANSYPSPPFSDVGGGHRFRVPIGWAAATNLADGFGDGTFRPTDAVSRQALAALLHRFHLMMGGVWPAPHHHHECTDPVTAEQQAAADQLVADVEASLARWSDKSAALADGYVQIAPPFGGAGAHYANVEFMNDGIIADPLKPESLMYDGPTLQGAMFLMEEVGAPGPMIGGCLTTWHTHSNLCYSGEPSEGGTIIGLSDWGCPGGTYVRITPAMLHVWIIPRPGGPFEGLET